MSNDSPPHVVHSLLADKLGGLAKQTSWLLGLAQHLHITTSVASNLLHNIELPEPESDRTVAIRWLASASNREVREALIAARGRRSACVMRTKLNGDLEEERGRRHPTNGRPRINGNGNAHASA
jgi:hypothetical protein